MDSSVPQQILPVDPHCENQLIYKKLINDESRQSTKDLIQLKCLISKGLPAMDKTHIIRLLFDRKHESIVVKQKGVIVGGVTYRIFKEPNFAQIAFLVVKYEKRIKGFGAKLMNKLKDEMQQAKISYLMTYGDNLALGFFKKQGFSTQIEMPCTNWQGFIKQYDGGQLMGCKINPKIDYINIKEIIAKQKKFVIDKIKENTTNQIKFCKHKIPELSPFEYEEQDGKRSAFRIDPRKIPGVVEAGWNWEEYEQLKVIEELSFPTRCMKILEYMQKQPQAWPFLEPVSLKQVPNYLQIVEKPMDIRTMADKVQNNKYTSEEQFCEDFKLIFDNCKLFNSQDTVYYKNAVKLQKIMEHKLQCFCNHVKGSQ